MSSRTVYSEELRKLNNEIIHMGDLAKEMVKKGTQAFLNGDIDLKAEVARLDHEIYRQDQLIEKHCVDIIALHQPVASDLRTVSTCLKIITDLNRIGRYGRDIAEMADHYDRDKNFKRLVAIPLMAELVVTMVTDSLDAFLQKDDRAARNMFRRDDEVDSLWDSIFRESLTYMIEDPRNITTGTHFILVARYLERIADHSCNIGDRVVFMVTGERIDPYERKKSRKEPEPPVVRSTVTPTDGYYAAHLDEK